MNNKNYSFNTVEIIDSFIKINSPEFPWVFPAPLLWSTILGQVVPLIF